MCELMSKLEESYTEEMLANEDSYAEAVHEGMSTAGQAKIDKVVVKNLSARPHNVLLNITTSDANGVVRRCG